ncbi:lipopolysaccharide biosynthesis protein [Bradyrhizobium sp. CCBAU 11386]|uniref:lipopolysaccharide biosynthesis protein n=1 Tax=Bradyrhizobium sp. CCBAU 11386 TaxID=1630837 RepID=UPI002303AEC8|nr:lipopolysaccharide biosynthesis protein [Bradyrhizobium sp. CCBAU 11386]
MDNLKRVVVRSGFVRLGGQAASFSLRLATMATLARLLEPQDFGLVAMTTVVTGVFQLLATTGLSSATIQKDTITHEQLSTLFWVNLLIGATLALLCVLAAPILVAFYNEPRLFWLTVAAGAGFILGAAGAQHSALLQRHLRYTALTVIEVLSLLVSFAAGVGMALVGLGYWAILSMALVSSAVYAICVWLVSGWSPALPRRTAGVRGLLGFGGVVTLNAFVVYVAYNVEKLLLGRYWGADALGIYERGYRLINIPTAELNSAIGGIAFSGLSRIQNDRIRLRNYFLKGYSIIVAMTIPITILCAVFVDDIIAVVLGPRWAAVADIFRLLTPTILIFGVINPVAWLLFALGLQVRSLKIALVIAPLVITAYIIGLPYGPRGVAFAYSAAMILWFIPHILWCLHGTLVSPRDLLLAAGRPLLAGIVAAGFGVAVELCLGRSEWHLAKLFVGGATVVAVYSLVLLFFMGQRTFYLALFKEIRGAFSAP